MDMGIALQDDAIVLEGRLVDGRYDSTNGAPPGLSTRVRAAGFHAQDRKERCITPLPIIT